MQYLKTYSLSKSLKSLLPDPTYFATFLLVRYQDSNKLFKYSFIINIAKKNKVFCKCFSARAIINLLTAAMCGKI